MYAKYIAVVVSEQHSLFPLSLELPSELRTRSWTIPLPTGDGRFIFQMQYVFVWCRPVEAPPINEHSLGL